MEEKGDSPVPSTATAGSSRNGSHHRTRSRSSPHQSELLEPCGEPSIQRLRRARPDGTACVSSPASGPTTSAAISPQPRRLTHRRRISHHRGIAMRSKEPLAEPLPSAAAAESASASPARTKTTTSRLRRSLSLGSTSDLQDAGIALSSSTHPSSPSPARRRSSRATPPFRDHMGNRHVELNMFASGFHSYLESGRFSDVIVVCCGREYHGHQMVLAWHSEFFERQLLALAASAQQQQQLEANPDDESHPASAAASPAPKQAVKLRLELTCTDPDDVFPHVVHFMYTGDVAITTENSVPLLALADACHITELKKRVSAFIASNVRRDNAVTMLRKALQFSAGKIVTRCIHVVAKNFSYIYDVKYDFLSPSLFQRLLQHRYLNITNEVTLYQVVRDYIVAKRDALRQEQVEALLAQVRYRWMPLPQLAQLAQERLVPHRFLMEAALARLGRHEAPDEATDVAVPPRLQRRPLYGVTIKFSGSGPLGAGIIDWISRGAGRGEWTNAHLAGQIIVTASSIERGKPHDLVGRGLSQLWTKDVPSSWFCIDLGPNRSVIPTYYSLRHGGNYRADSLRNWDFQGSKDGVEWTTLLAHRHDSSLKGPFAIASWSVQGVQTPYRFFRIIQTGHNSSSHNFLVLSSMELYGELFENNNASMLL